jgi:alanyl-tRNA synthetase
VRPDKLRFDFTHSTALSADERAEVERRVNEQVFANQPVRTFETPLGEARKLGAMMLFGEKYGDIVRVVEVDDYSRELCGGTHVRTTAEVGPFVILSEGSVGSGARRIEAVTAADAYALLHGRAQEADELRVELAHERKEAKRKPTEPAQQQELTLRHDSEVGGVAVVVGQLDGVDADTLLDVSDREKQRRGVAAVVLGSREDGRVHLVANFDGAVAERVSAGDVIKAASAVVGGGGGGRPTMARGGGTNPEKLDEALAAAEQAIRSALE